MEPEDVLALGRRLVKELELEPGVDTLGRWMAHHLAEVITRAASATDPVERSAATDQAVETILRICRRPTHDASHQEGGGMIHCVQEDEMARRTADLQTRAISDRIRSAVHEVEPTAQVILYGSRARGDAAADSDWDILVLVDGPVDPLREVAITRRLFDLELETDAVLSSVVHSKEDWASRLFQAMPFHENVTREGITL